MKDPTPPESPPERRTESRLEPPTPGSFHTPHGGATPGDWSDEELDLDDGWDSRGGAASPMAPGDRATSNGSYVPASGSYAPSSESYAPSSLNYAPAPQSYLPANTYQSQDGGPASSALSLRVGGGGAAGPASPDAPASPAAEKRSEFGGGGYLSTSPQSSPENDVRSKLRSALGKFESIENVLRIGARQRRDADEHRLASLRIQMSNLEQTLATEVTRRIELQRKLEAWCKTSVEALRADISASMDDHEQRMDAVASAVQERVREAAERMEEEASAAPAAAERRARELETSLKEVRAAFDEERADRLRRESQILQRIDDHGLEVAGRVTGEAQTRQAGLDRAAQLADRNGAAQRHADANFHGAANRDLRALRTAVRTEAKARQEDDRAVVAALERYTSKLHASLTIVSSGDGAGRM
eukprot:CAMPEP_0194273806 /NCGR_PEP_ID=MMETSP0169-20130528/7069_1 /TAXON_ID=218684 /ORGANISM="Corethron pennatum, Strain L29A3" /LENGTH=416 /DNA_ID=CAMNT_0039016871 /DNA_START=53 /DNA_END=1303 /DNA_ORIENTATION=-